MSATLADVRCNVQIIVEEDGGHQSQQPDTASRPTQEDELGYADLSLYYDPKQSQLTVELIEVG